MKYLGLSEFSALITGLFKNDIKTFEKEFSEYIGVRYALGTSYGRTALYLALRSLEINDKEVLLPSFSCSVVRDAVCLAGATPVFIDVDPKTLEMNLKDIEKHISEKTKAIIIIHYYGKPCSNMDKILKSAKEKNIFVMKIVPTR